MNKSGLVNEVKQRLGVSSNRAKSLVNAVLEEMGGALAQGQKVALRGLEFVPTGPVAAAATTVARRVRGDGAGQVWAKATEAAPTGASAPVAVAAKKVAPAKKAAGPAAPAKKTAAKKTAAKKAAPAKKVAGPAAAAKKTAAKKAAAPARSTVPVEEVATSKSAPAIKTVAKKAAPAKKTAAKKAAPAKKAVANKSAADRTALPPAAPGLEAGTEPRVVPYEPLHDPAADAIAAAAAEQARPVGLAQPWGDSTRVVSTMPEPELREEPDTLAYSSGTADPDETIGERVAD